VVELYSRRSAIGLVGSTINVESGKWIDTASHISGGIDSYYEYLLKSWLLFNDQDCKKMWKPALRRSTNTLLTAHARACGTNRLEMNTGKQLSTHYGALDAFFPAVLARSGDLDRARRLQESSYKMWTTFGIEPEELDYSTMKLVSPGYALRPEIN